MTWFRRTPFVFVLLAGAALAQDNLKYGDPGCTGPAEEHRQKLDHKYYVVCHSGDLKIPLWVGYELKSTDLDGPAERPSGFKADKMLEPGYRAVDADYRGSGYARGHMAPAEDFSRSEEAIKETFFLSNVVPQNTRVNSGRWAQLEAAVREATRNAGHAYIFTGPVFTHNDVPTIGSGVGIPDETFKVVLTVGPGENEMKMYAVIMPNSADAREPLGEYKTTVKDVEQKTGFVFFAALDDEVEQTLKAATEPLKAPSRAKKRKPAIQ